MKISRWIELFGSVILAFLLSLQVVILKMLLQTLFPQTTAGIFASFVFGVILTAIFWLIIDNSIINLLNNKKIKTQVRDRALIQGLHYFDLIDRYVLYLRVAALLSNTIIWYLILNLVY